MFSVKWRAGVSYGEFGESKAAGSCSGRDALDGEYRSTPLGFAARWNYRDVALLLIERRGGCESRRRDWARPITWARRKGYAEMVELLRGQWAIESAAIEAQRTPGSAVDWRHCVVSSFPIPRNTRL